MAQWQYRVMVRFPDSADQNHTTILYTETRAPADREASRWTPEYVPRVLHRSDSYRYAVLAGLPTPETTLPEYY